MGSIVAGVVSEEIGRIVESVSPMYATVMLGLTCEELGLYRYSRRFASLWMSGLEDLFLLVVCFTEDGVGVTNVNCSGLFV